LFSHQHGFAQVIGDDCRGRKKIPIVHHRNIIYSYIENKTEFQSIKEITPLSAKKRDHACIENELGSADKTMQAGIVLNISLDGLQISIRTAVSMK